MTASPRWLPVLAVLASGLADDVGAQDTGDGGARSRSPARAVARAGEIRIDGRLDESAWQAAPAATGFVQRDPVEGAPADEKTEVRILFDESAVYVAARMFDGRPEQIADQLVRRDERGQYDYFEVAFDPNLDRRTGYLFRVSAAMKPVTHTVCFGTPASTVRGCVARLYNCTCIPSSTTRFGGIPKYTVA